MSLIHEALRKARREASHQDDPGVVFPGGLTGRGRHSGLRTGLILGIVVTVVAGAILGGGLWWTLQKTSDKTTTPTESGSDQAVRSPVAEPAPSRFSTPGAEPEAPLVPLTEQDPNSHKMGPPEHEVNAADFGGTEPAGVAAQDAAVNTDAAPPTPVTQRRTASGEREFLVDADLGYATLSLDYIMISPTESFAEINGFEVRVGGHIEGFTVEEITEDRVKLRDAKGPLVLRVPPSR